MNGQYKKDEKVIKYIIKQNVKPTNENEKIDVVIYYKNLKTKKLIMNNNMSRITQDPLLTSYGLCTNSNALMKTVNFLTPRT